MPKKDHEFQRLAAMYPYIYGMFKKWGLTRALMLNDLRMAEKEKAPANATYRIDHGAWRTTDELTDAAIAVLDKHIEAGRRCSFAR